ncbi:MAG TPA: AAA family ATPase [Anaeromyxobacteraceae bacterium]|nr:AAA family ATPase [Anaeromyxobacteraceae bacterium]
MTAPAQEVAELWSAGNPVLYLAGPDEERSLAACADAAAQLGARAVTWSTARGLEGVDAAARTPEAVLDALSRASQPLLVAALDFHVALRAPAVARRLKDLAPRMEQAGCCLAIVAPRVDLPEGLEGEVAVVRVPPPVPEELGAQLDAVRSGVAGEAAGPLPPDVRQRAVIAAQGLTRAQAQRAFVRALQRDPALGDVGLATLVDEKGRRLGRDLGLEIVDPSGAEEVLGGLATFKAWMEERAAAFRAEAGAYGLEAPRGVLLVGVQGCGKSLAAKVAAARLGVPILRLDLPLVLGARDGAEESLARAVEAAEGIAPVALWVDEIEKGFAGSSPGDGADPRAARLLGAFSTWLQERKGPVFVVATANDVTRLPPELLRRGRFDELFFVDLPDIEARREILSLHLRRRGRDPALVDVPALAEVCADYSGAELEQVVVGALHRSFVLGREVETTDLRRVAQDLVPLFRTYEEQIKTLREWARGRARVAGRTGAVVDLFRRAGG